jgi:AraC-like DNA-binding protein
MVVVAFVQSAEIVARLRQAAYSDTTLVLHTATSDISVVSATHADAILIEFTSDLNCLLPVVETLHTRQPHTPIAVYCALDPQSAKAIVRLAHAGVSEVVLRGYDDLRLWLRQHQRTAAAPETTRRIMELLSPQLPHAVAPLVEYCVRQAHHAPSVASIARGLGVHRRTLVNQLAAEGYPTPRAVISWCRLFVAIDRLERLQRPVAEVAHTLRFGSAAALYKMCVRYTGLTITELRCGNALATAVSLFLTRSSRQSELGDHADSTDARISRSTAPAHSVRRTSHSDLVAAEPPHEDRVTRRNDIGRRAEISGRPL